MLSQNRFPDYFITLAFEGVAPVQWPERRRPAWWPSIKSIPHPGLAHDRVHSFFLGPALPVAGEKKPSPEAVPLLAPHQRDSANASFVIRNSSFSLLRSSAKPANSF
jgi:hypothetical protein